MAGNGTIGLEILEDLPDPDAVVIPYGGGGLTVGIASAIERSAPDQDLHRRAGDRRGAGRSAEGRRAAEVDYEPSFVDGSGSRRVLDSMWPRCCRLSTTRSRSRSPMPRPRSGCSPSASG